MSLKRVRSTPNMPGFANEGNTCYFSAAVQALMHVPQLVNYVRDPLFEKTVGKKTTNATVSRAFADVAEAYWTADTTAVLSCKALREAFCAAHPAFRSRETNDAGEVLALALATMHAEMSGLHAPEGSPTVLGHPVPFSGGADSLRAWMDDVDTEGRSMVSEIFKGQEMHGTSATTDTPGFRHFWGLVLHARDTLDKAVAAHLETTTLTRLPLVLVVSLVKSEVKQFVSYDAVMTLPEGETTQRQYARYALSSVLMHHGDGHGHVGGHWTALCKLRGEWRHFDDDGVTPVKVNDIVQRDAVVLVYTRLLA